MLRRAGIGLVLLVAFGCAPLPQRGGVPVEQRPSPNFNERRPNYVILHHTSSPKLEQALRTLTGGLREVSAHYLVARDGTIYYLVDELARAWHAGESYWMGQRDLNSASIGIELDNDGEAPFTEDQLEALLTLLADLKTRYAIPTGNFLGHGDVAPRRKVDPGRNFPWKRLAQRGFGLWCEPPYPELPAGVDDLLLLQAFGYDVADADAAVAAFKRRFAPEDASDTMSDGNRALLHCLLLQQRRTR